MKLNPDFLAALKANVQVAPYPNLLGMVLSDIGVGQCRVELQLDRRHLQPFGIVHGGVLSALLDTATFWAAYLSLPQGTGLVNVDLKLNYLKAATTGLLRAEGVCLRAGRQISVAEASVFDDSGERVAHGSSTLLALPGRDLDLGIQKFLP